MAIEERINMVRAAMHAGAMQESSIEEVLLVLIEDSSIDEVRVMLDIIESRRGSDAPEQKIE